jgi:uncharacterized repeat protein (TIGR01451 family)
MFERMILKEEQKDRSKGGKDVNKETSIAFKIGGAFMLLLLIGVSLSFGLDYRGGMNLKGLREAYRFNTYAIQHSPAFPRFLSGTRGIEETVWFRTYPSGSSVVFSPDGKLIATPGGGFATIWLFNTSDGSLARILIGHTGQVRSVAFSPDGKLLASGSEDSTIKIWRVEDWQCIKTLTGHTSIVTSVAFSPDGSLLASGSWDDTIKLWKVSDGSCIKTLTGHTSIVTSVAFSPDGSLLASGCDGTIKLWRVADGTCIKTLTGHTFGADSLAFSPDGTLLVSGNTWGAIEIWNVSDGSLLKRLTDYAPVNSVAFPPDGSLLASGSGDRTIKLWRVSDGTCIKTLADHTWAVWSVAFSPDGKLLASGSGDKTIKLWRVSDGSCIKTLTGHTDGVNSVAFSPDGNLLASGSWDDTIKLWRVSDGTCIKTLTGHTDGVNSVAFSPDGNLLASGSWDDTIKLWRVSDGTCIKTLTGHTDAVYSVAFSPDGSLLASGSEDNTIKLWRVSDGTCINTLTGYTFWVASVAFSPDGTLLASGGDDGIAIWRMSQILDTTPPTIPGNLKAQAVSSSEIDLRWDASTDSGGSGLAGYSIERRISEGSFSEIAKVDANTTGYKDTGLSANTTYEYRVRAYDKAGNYSDYSNIASVITEKVGKWTVMIYISFKNNLISTLDELLEMLSSAGSTADVRIVAQIMKQTAAGRYYFKEKNVLPLSVDRLGVVNSADPATLADFIKWAAQNYPAEHYALIINDHGAGWREGKDENRGISVDDFSSHNIMSIPELRKALEAANIHFDLIGMHACLMQMIEVATEIKDWTKVICASEAIMYSLLPYDKFISKLLYNPNMNEIDLGKEIVDSYVCTQESFKTEVTLSLISTSSISQLAQAVDKLAGKLISLYPSQKATIEEAIEKTQNFAYEGRWTEYKDLFRFAANIYMALNDGEVLSLAKDIISLKGKVVLYERHSKEGCYSQASGLSIYLPQNGFDGNYTLLSFASIAPNWLAFIQQTSNLQIITKIVDKGRAKVDDYLNYTIIVANTTHTTLSNIKITDKIPTETSYVEGSATGNPTFDPTTNTLQWSIDSLLPTQMVSLSFKVRVEKSGLHFILNQAHLEGSGLSIDSNKVLTVLFTLSKSSNTATTNVGSEITYSIHYENGTGETLTNIKIIDQLPQYTSFVRGSKRGNPDYDPTTNQVIWTIDSLPPDAVGDISYQVKVLEDAPDGAQLTSTASLQVGDEKILDSNSVVTVVDKTPPSIRILLPQSGISCLPIIVFEATDLNPSPSGVNVKIDGQEVTPLFDEISTYRFALPNTILSPGQHSLTISATDMVGNSNEQTFTFTVSSQPFPQSQIALISFPFHITGSLSSVVGTLEKACVWTGKGYADANSISLYHGVWVKLASPLSPANLALAETIDTVNSGENEASISLQKGWRAFGLPWSYPLPISALQIEDKNGKRMSFSDAGNIIGLILFRYDGQKYVSVSNIAGMENTLYPWFGYWIMVKDDCKLIFPNEPWNVKVKRTSNLDGFCLPIKAVFSDGTSEDVYIGIGKQEITSPFPPPAPYSQNQKRLSIIKNGELLYLDIRREGGKQEWRLAVKGDATLFFPNLSYLPKGWQAILTDGDKRYYIKTTSAIKVEGDKELKVEIGEGLVTPLLINMLEARSVRGGVNISWNVNLPCQVKVAIKGADGRVLRDLGMRTSSSGLNSIFWDGKGQDGRNLPAGIYIIELTARDELNQMIKTIRMVNLR